MAETTKITFDSYCETPCMLLPCLRIHSTLLQFIDTLRLYTRNSSFLKTAILGTLNLQGALLATQQSSPSPQGQLFDPHTRSRKEYRFLIIFFEIPPAPCLALKKKKLFKTSNAIHVVITVAFSLRTLAGRLTAGVPAKTRACDQLTIFTTDHFFSIFH